MPAGGYVHHLSAGGLTVLVMGGISIHVPRINIPASWWFDGTFKKFCCWVPDQGTDYARAIFKGDAVSCCTTS
jgi:hypothetical protein